MMKKILFGALALLLLTDCSGRNEEKKREDSIRRADTIATVEVAMQTEEQAMLDSIRQDSIDLEERLRIDPIDMDSRKDYKKFVKKYDFKLVKKEKEEDPDNDIVSETITYSRTINGRKTDLIIWSETYSGMDLKFYDKTDKENFINDMINKGFKKKGNYYVNSKTNQEISYEGKEFGILF